VDGDVGADQEERVRDRARERRDQVVVEGDRGPRGSLAEDLGHERGPDARGHPRDREDGDADQEVVEVGMVAEEADHGREGAVSGPAPNTRAKRASTWPRYRSRRKTCPISSSLRTRRTSGSSRTRFSKSPSVFQASMAWAWTTR